MNIYTTFIDLKNVTVVKKILFLFSIVSFFLCSHKVFAQTYSPTYIPIDKNSNIQSVVIAQKNATIKMVDYTVSFPIDIMNGTQYHRATGITEGGMKIGFKYNKNLLRLLVIDAEQKNYMVSDFIAKDANIKDLKLPPNYKQPIDSTEVYVSSVQFIASYPFWNPNSTARGFDLLVTKEKGIIGLFPAIQLELADKLCRADTVTSGIFELLSDTHKITCDMLSVFSQEKYHQKLTHTANLERPLLTKVLECSQGGRQPKYCQKINQQLAQKTLNNISIQSLLGQIIQ